MNIPKNYNKTIENRKLILKSVIKNIQMYKLKSVKFSDGVELYC